MSTATSAHPPGYWLGTGPCEIEHLVAQAEVYAAEAEELLDRIGLQAGAAAIDVGFGVQSILDVLRGRVGAGGRVVGLDLEARMLALAAERVPGIETVQADATATGLEPESFDLVHERTLLLNVTDPQAAVAEMVRLARPGGVVVLQEPDASVWICAPPHPASFIVSLCRLLREPLVATGTLSAGELDRGVAEVQEHLLRRDTITCQPLLWQAWGTKPS